MCIFVNSTSPNPYLYCFIFQADNKIITNQNQTKMSKENQKTYSAPTIEVLNARIESGFEGSVTPVPEPNQLEQPEQGENILWG